MPSVFRTSSPLGCPAGRAALLLAILPTTLPYPGPQPHLYSARNTATLHTPYSTDAATGLWSKAFSVYACMKRTCVCMLASCAGAEHLAGGGRARACHFLGSAGRAVQVGVDASRFPWSGESVTMICMGASFLNSRHCLSQQAPVGCPFSVVSRAMLLRGGSCYCFCCLAATAEAPLFVGLPCASACPCTFCHVSRQTSSPRPKRFP